MTIQQVVAGTMKSLQMMIGDAGWGFGIVIWRETSDLSSENIAYSTTNNAGRQEAADALRNAAKMIEESIS